MADGNILIDRDSKTSATTVANTVTETTLASKALPTGLVAATGTNIRFRASGVVSGLQDDVLTLRIKYGSTTLGTAAFTFQKDEVDVGWSFVGDITTTSSGNVEAQGQFFVKSPAVAYSEKTWAFRSPSGGSGTWYFGGYYIHDTTGGAVSSTTFPVNLGNSNASYAAHVYFVNQGFGAVGTEVIRVTGTSITDAGVRTTSDTEDLTWVSPGANDYQETSKKFLGQVSISHVSGPNNNFNYGWCKYWDNNNTDFRVSGIEATWLGGAIDSAPDILLRHHKTTGWTASASAAATPPTAICSLNTDHSTEDNVKNNEEGAYKRTNLNTAIAGSGSEGTIVEVQTSANNAFALGNFLMRIQTTLGGDSPSIVHLANTSTTAVTTTGVVTPTITAQWDTADASDSITCRSFILSSGGLI